MPVPIPSDLTTQTLRKLLSHLALGGAVYLRSAELRAAGHSALTFSVREVHLSIDFSI